MLPVSLRVGVCALLALALAPARAAAGATRAVAEDQIDLPPMEPAVPDADADDHAATSPAPAKTVEEAPSAEPQPELRPSQAVSAPEPSGELSEDEKDEQTLASPTRSFDDYESARKRYLHKSTMTQYSINLTIEPKAFGKVDLRTPANIKGLDATDPNLMGVLLGYDHTIYNRKGLALLGVDGGLYSSTEKDPYSGLLTAFISVSPHLQYEGLFIPGQWVVPTVKVGGEILRYNYSLQNKAVKGMRVLPRIEIGMLFFLNVLEPSSAGQMQESYGVHRTYLSAYYSIASDSSKTDFDLSESTFRVGLRFEH